MKQQVEEQEPDKHGHSRAAHPAFGMIGASRCSSGEGVALAGTDFLHRNFVRVQVMTAHRSRGLHQDGYYGDRQVVELYLSEAQWAAFVSSMNVGDGVPCTLARVVGESVPELPPPQSTRRDQFSREVRESFGAVIDEARRFLGLIKNDHRLKLSEIKTFLHHVENLGPNAEFTAKEFDKHADRTVVDAKMEVAAYVQHAVTRAGLTALRDGGAAIIELPDAKPRS